MKKRKLLLGILLLLASCSDTTKDSSETTDPETVDPVVPPYRVLYNFDDITTGTTGFVPLIPEEENSTLTFTTETDESNRVGAAKYTLDKGESKWEPFVKVLVALNDGEGYDASPYKGISYRYRGAGHMFFFEIAEVVDYAHFNYAVPYSADWDTVTIDFEKDLRQLDWGTFVPFSAENLLAISWGVSGTTGDSGSFQIDDVTLVQNVEKEIQHDMEIKDPEIPELLPITPGSVTNPNQAKAMKYLTKGVSFASWLEVAGPITEDKYNAERVAKLASQGIKGIRLPIDLDRWVVNKAEVIAGTAPFSLEPELFMWLDSLLLWTEENNLSLTIDYHQYDNSLNSSTVSDPGYSAMAANCWKAVAAHYVDNRREDLFYELTNEPGIGDNVPNDEWMVMAKEILDSIRSVDATRSVIYGTSRWYNIDVLVNSPLFAPDDENLIYAFHFYEPFVFTHQAAGWSGMGSTSGVPYPYSKEKWSTEFSDFGVTAATADWIKYEYRNYYRKGNKNAMMNLIIPVFNWAVENNVAVICNESGAYQLYADQESRKNYFIDAVANFDELNIPWSSWFGMFDDNDDLIPGIAEPLGLVE